VIRQQVIALSENNMSHDAAPCMS